MPPSLAAAYGRPHPPRGEVVEPDLGRAFAGLGLVMEYLGHRIRDAAEPESALPVQLGELEPSFSTRGLEAVAVDLSEYGDPLHTREVAVPFTRYRKPEHQRSRLGEHVVSSLPAIYVIPHPGTTEAEAIRTMRDRDRAMELARSASTRIPKSATGMEALVAAYDRSPLAEFHDHFYSADHDPPEVWPETS